MDRYHDLLSQARHNAGWQIAATAVSAVVLVFLLWQYIYEVQALEYSVPVPEQCKEGYWDDYDPLTASKGTSGSYNQDEDDILCICPADGRVLDATFKAQNRECIDTAIHRATDAQSKWAETTFAQRRLVLRTLLKYVLDHQEDIVTACCLDSGKTRLDAYFGEILVTAEKLKWTIQHGEKAVRTSKRPTNFLMFYKDNEVRYEPLGVVSACVSWNYPFHNFISPIISAIFAGNAIVVKPSEQVAWSSTYFTNIAKGAIARCGYDDDLVQTVVCLPKDADYLTSHSGLSHITFIGSREIAHKVCASASKSLTPVCVELGGKDPAIILDDERTVANLEDVASILMRGVFQNAGQNCIGIERVIALPGVYDKLIDIVKSRIENLKVGSGILDERWVNRDPKQYETVNLEGVESNGSGQAALPSGSSGNSSLPVSSISGLSADLRPHIDTTFPPTTDMGAMISSRQFSRLQSLVASAVESGAVLHHGGRPLPHPRYPDGTYFTPTLLTSVTPSMDISQTELFAPVFLMMRATSVSDAITLANSCPYALGASIFGYDKLSLETCTTSIKAGMVSLNDFGAFYATSLPFGGVKGSGYGRFGGEEGLRSLCNIKSVCRDRWSGFGLWIPPLFPLRSHSKKFWLGWNGISTKIPWLVDLPAPKKTGSSARGSLTGRDMVRGVVETGYALDLKGRVKGVRKMVGALRGG